MNPSQPDLIRVAVERLPPGAAVRVARDNDEEGAGFAATIEEPAAEAGREDLAVERAMSVAEKDWNEALLGARRAASAIR